MNNKKYGYEVLDVIFGFGWLSNESTRGWYEKQDSGIWVAKHDGHMDNLLFGEDLRHRFLHPTGRWDSEPALPIPFTEKQFRKFLDSNTLVTESEVRSWFADDDGYRDQLKLSRIHEFCPDAAELLELLLLPADCRASLVSEAAQQDAPVCAKQALAPVAAVSASYSPTLKPTEKSRTWRDVSSAYIVEVMKAGQYATCKELYRALEAKAGPETPFDRGTGANRGSLFVREIAQPLSLKTVQNNFRRLRELAQKPAP